MIKRLALALGAAVITLALTLATYALPKADAEPSTETQYLETLEANGFEVVDTKMTVGHGWWICAGLVLGTPAKLIEEAVTYQLDLTLARAGDLVSIAASTLCPTRTSLGTIRS